MEYVYIAIMVMSILDMLATYNYLKTFHKKFPKLDYTQLEANPLLRYWIKKKGMKQGMITGGIQVFLILCIVMYLLADLNWLYYMAGTFSMMLIYHFANSVQLSNMKPKRGKK